MEIEVTSRTNGIPDQAKDYAREKLGKVARIFDRIGRLHVSLEQGKDESRAHAVAHLDSGSTLVAETAHGELRAAIDLVSDKLERQVRREKERLIGRSRKSHGTGTAPPPEDGEGPAYQDAIREPSEE